MMNEYTIGQVASAAGVPASTLRYYESIGILPASRRVSGQRRYEDDVFQTLELIQVAKQASFSLKEIELLMGEISAGSSLSGSWKELAQQKLVEVDALIARAQGMKRILLEGLDCECLNLNDCQLLMKDRIDVT
jgi:MerR family redox-sensitive transcriptional activator SoxR